MMPKYTDFRYRRQLFPKKKSLKKNKKKLLKKLLVTKIVRIFRYYQRDRGPGFERESEE